MSAVEQRLAEVDYFAEHMGIGQDRDNLRWLLSRIRSMQAVAEAADAYLQFVDGVTDAAPEGQIPPVIGEFRVALQAYRRESEEK